MNKLIIYFLITLSIFSCRKIILEEDPKNTPINNFEYLWNIIDIHYSFFEYKHVNWDSIHTIYSPKIYNSMDKIQLFNVLASMINELRDAHVQLTSSFNSSQYEKYFQSSPENFDNALVNNNYLENNYFTTGPFKHQIISNGTIGYIRYDSFINTITNDDLDFIINRFQKLNGIILDLRNNGGGYVNNIFIIGSHFIDSSRLVYYSYIKNGPSHNDFENPDPVYLNPSLNHFSKTVCLLTNRNCYSATSFFVLALRNFPNVCVIGDTTGGGLGAPSGAELPNGWGIKFSVTKTLDPFGYNFENGIPPDIKCFLTSQDKKNGFDTIIERAISFINDRK